jgi:hypothetical protein
MSAIPTGTEAALVGAASAHFRPAGAGTSNPRPRGAALGRDRRVALGPRTEVGTFALRVEHIIGNAAGRRGQGGGEQCAIS